MSGYAPTSRRPIGGVFRRSAHGAVGFCVRHGVHPDAVSYASVVAAALAAFCFWRAPEQPFLWLVLGPVFCYLRLFFNMLDGMVALASGKASLYGEIVNDFPDRVSDIVIFVAVARSGLASPDLGYLGACFAVLTAYAGVLGQAVGVQREFSGWMSKPWRMVTLHAGAWGTLALFAAHRLAPDQASPAMDAALLLVAAGCVQTVAVRLVRIRRALLAKAERA